MAALLGYLNPYPTYGTSIPSPYNYGPKTGIGQALRWGLSRGITLDSLEIESVVPDTGPAAGGTTVILRGSGFKTGAIAKFGVTPATQTLVQNSTLIIAVTPPHAAGAVDVTVENPDTSSVTKPGAYTYT
jgi:hypothetical protein